VFDLHGPAPTQDPESVGFAPKYFWPQRVAINDLICEGTA